MPGLVRVFSFLSWFLSLFCDDVTERCDAILRRKVEEKRINQEGGKGRGKRKTISCLLMDRVEMERSNASFASNPNPNGSLNPSQVSNPISTNSNSSSNATNPTASFTGSNPNLNLEQPPLPSRTASNQQSFSSNQRPIASSSKNTLDSFQRNGNNPNGNHSVRPATTGQNFARNGNVNQNRNPVLNRPQSQLDENQRIKFQIHSKWVDRLTMELGVERLQRQERATEIA